MPNIHGLHSIRSNDPPSRRGNDDDSDDDEDDSNRRYVGGIDARGGGSGLAVLPNPNELRPGGAGGAADLIFGMAESSSLPSSSNSGGGNGSGETSRRTITMYRSGFTVDDGPYRRLDDVNNTEFLTSLARGRIPRELQPQAQQGGDDNDEDEDDDNIPEVMVGLVDRRSEEYDPNRHGNSGNNGGPTPSFTGEGNSLGGGSSSAIASTSGGIIDPASSSDMSSTTAPLPIDETRPVTTIAVRLLDGKRLVVKVNTDVAVIEVTRHIGTNSGSDRYVMTSGFPPSIIEDLTQSVESAGLKGAQVVLKKA